MIKRIIAFLVSVALVMAMLPLAALAEETAVTPEKVGEAIEQAQSSAMDAAVANAASGQVQTAADEVIAVANEKLAENELDDAQSVVEGANTDNAERAEAAQEAAKDAADAADQAKEDQKVATEAKKDAQEALEEAKDADTKGEAVNAAEKAEEASEAAKEAANDAIAQSAVASQKAQDAKAAYEAAEEAARKADEEAKALLESGLINMGEAEKRTAEAAQRAQDKYVNLMIEKGYLVPRKENSNVYDFYEVPKRKEDKEAVSPCELKSLPDGNDDLRGRLVTSQGNKEIYNNTDYLIDKNINRAEFIF